MTTPLRISICIPTYNRGPYLATLFQSILDQVAPGCTIEVVVSDNASIDETASVVAAWRDRFDHIVYDRTPENIGADRNYLRVVELASGDYCWLMGSDDKLEPGAVAAVVDSIRSSTDIAGLSARVRAYDSALHSLIPLVTSDRYPDRDVVLTGAEHIFSELNEYFGFISSNIVDRQLWRNVVMGEDLTDFMNAWVHVYVIGRMIQRRPRWAFVAQPSVGWRSGNDSFVAEGAYRRLEIDVAGYSEVTAGLFGATSDLFRETMSRRIEPAFFKLLGAKMHGAPRAYYRRAWRLLYHHLRSHPAFWFRIVPVFAMPGFAPRAGRWLYRRTLKPYRSARLGRSNDAPRDPRRVEGAATPSGPPDNEKR